MSEGMKSKYVFASIGVVVETKPEGSDVVIASPIEVLYDQGSGSIKNQKREFEGNVASIGSENLTTQNKASRYLRARWRPMSSTNRVTPPDVCQGERVQLWTYEGTDNWYWDDLGREPALRGREDVVYLFSNVIGGGKGEKYDLSNSYFLRVSTKKSGKMVHLHTTDNDGEASAYDFKFDTAKGTVQLVDKQGNDFLLNSVEGVFTGKVNNKVHWITKETVIDSEDSITFNTKTFVTNASNNVDFNTPIGKWSKDVRIDNLLSTGSHTSVGGNLSVAGGITSGGGGMRSMRSAPMTYGIAKPAAFSAKSSGLGSGASITGNVRIIGTLQVSSSVTFGSTLTVAGSVSVTGSITSSTSVNAPNIR